MGVHGMKRVLLAALLVLVAAGSGMAEEPRQRVMSIPLDMPLEADLDGEFLEGIYQEKLIGELKDSVLIEAPIQHIESSFTENRRLQLWFSAREDGRRVFWAHLTQSFGAGAEQTPESLLANFAATYGKPDVVRTAKGGSSGSWILLKLDPRLPETRRAAMLKQLEAAFNPNAEQIGDFLFLDMRDRAKLLGADFRGALLSFTAFQGKVAAQRIELLDLARAATVLNLAQ